MVSPQHTEPSQRACLFLCTSLLREEGHGKPRIVGDTCTCEHQCPTVRIAATVALLASPGIRFEWNHVACVLCAGCVVHCVSLAKLCPGDGPRFTRGQAFGRLPSGLLESHRERAGPAGSPPGVTALGASVPTASRPAGTSPAVWTSCQLVPRGGVAGHGAVNVFYIFPASPLAAS